MDCMEFKNIVVDLFDRETDPQVKAESERHMAECDECKRYYDEMAHVTALLRPRHSPGKTHRPESVGQSVYNGSSTPRLFPQQKTGLGDCFPVLI